MNEVIIGEDCISVYLRSQLSFKKQIQPTNFYFSPSAVYQMCTSCLMMARLALEGWGSPALTPRQLWLAPVGRRAGYALEWIDGFSVSFLAKCLSVPQQVDHQCRVSHEAGGLPYGWTRLPPQVWKLWVFIIYLFLQKKACSHFVKAKYSKSLNI